MIEQLARRRASSEIKYSLRAQQRSADDLGAPLRNKSRRTPHAKQTASSSHSGDGLLVNATDRIQTPQYIKYLGHPFGLILISTPMPAPYKGQCLCGGCQVFVDVEPTLGIRLISRAQISVLISINDRGWVSVTARIAPIAVV